MLHFPNALAAIVLKMVNWNAITISCWLIALLNYLHVIWYCPLRFWINHVYRYPSPPPSQNSSTLKIIFLVGYVLALGTRALVWRIHLMTSTNVWINVCILKLWKKTSAVLVSVLPTLWISWQFQISKMGKESH